MTAKQVNDKYLYPWHEKGVTPLVKMLAILGILVLFCAAFSAISTLMTTLLAVMTEPQGLSPGPLLNALLFLLIPLVVLGLVIFGLKKIWPYAFAPGDFKLKGSPVAADALSQGFEVRFSERFPARTFRGKGGVRFEAEQLVLDGALPPSLGLQLGIIAVVTLVPLLLFGVGLGIIPAFILAGLIGKKETSRHVLYGDTRELSVKGRVVSFSCPGEAPNKFKFRVASADSERLYRELYQHCPQAVAEWGDQLRRTLG